MSHFLYILLAILLLGIIIMFHELGHYVVGRLCGIGIVEFSIGFGPKLIGREINGIQYSLRALPLGGYCAFVGEDDSSPAPNAMRRQPVWKRFLTVAAGPAMNFLIAYLAAVLMLCAFPSVLNDVYPQAQVISEGMPAEAAGIQPGDVIVAVDGEPVSYDLNGVELVRQALQERDDVVLTLDRGGETVSVTLSPTLVELSDGTQRRQIGITFLADYARMPLFTALGRAAVELKDMTGEMLSFLRGLIFHGQGANDMAGAIGTVAVVSDVLEEDHTYALYIIVIISLNLGIINLLPLPALDGGRLVFLIVEAIRRKPIPPEKEGMVHLIGLGLFFLLAIVLAWHDIVTFVIGR